MLELLDAGAVRWFGGAPPNTSPRPSARCGRQRPLGAGGPHRHRVTHARALDRLCLGLTQALAHADGLDLALRPPHCLPPAWLVPESRVDTLMRVVSWNMAHRRESWAAVRGLLGDGSAVGLLQEAVDPAGDPAVEGLTLIPGGVGPLPWSTHAGFRRSWATAIAATPDLDCTPAFRVSLQDATGETLAISHPGSYAAALIRQGGHRELGVVAVYGIWDRQDAVGIYSEATLHRTISDLTPWLHDPPPGGLVLAGDLNCYLDHGDYWNDRYMTVFNRIRAYLQLLGPTGEGPLPGCRCNLGDNCRHVQTYAHHRQPTSNPYQLDFAFADRVAARRVTACRVVPGATFEHSDHLPIEVTLNDAATT